MKNPKVIGYFVDENEKPNAGTVFVAINEVWNLDGDLTAYCPIGQHGAASREYIKECKEITLDEYLKHSKGIYTPEEYLIGEG